MAKPPKTPKKPRGKAFEAKGYDWAAIEAAYRSGAHSNRKISADYGPSEAAIRKRAQEEGWIKGEAHAVRALAYEKANDVAVPGYVPHSPERIERIAAIGADILVRHRRDAAVLQSLVQDMAQQLRHQTHHEPDLAASLEEYFMLKAANNPLLAGAYKQQLNSALHALGLNARSKTMVNLANAMDKLVGIERKAWSLDEDDDKRNYEDLLAEISEKLGKKP